MKRISHKKDFEIIKGVCHIPEDALLGERSVKSSALKVLSVYCYFDEQFNREPTPAELIQYSSLSSRTIMFATRELEQKGFLYTLLPINSDRYKKQRISEELRWEIFERDNFTCRQCGIRRCLTVDHIKPEKLGGTLDKENLRTLCRPCNSKKGIKQ